KEELLNAILTKHNFLEEVRHTLQFHDELPIDQTLYRLGEKLLKLMVNKSSFVVMVFGEAQRNSKIAYKFEAIVNQGVTALGGFLEKRAEKKEIKDLDYKSLARHFIGSLFIYFLTCGKTGTEKEHKIYLETIVHALSEGIKTD